MLKKFKARIDENLGTVVLFVLAMIVGASLRGGQYFFTLIAITAILTYFYWETGRRDVEFVFLKWHIYTIHKRGRGEIDGEKV